MPSCNYVEIQRNPHRIYSDSLGMMNVIQNYACAFHIRRPVGNILERKKQKIHW